MVTWRRWAERVLLVTAGIPVFILAALVFGRWRAMIETWQLCWREAGGQPWK